MNSITEQLNKAMDYIEEHIEDEMLQDDVSFVTSYSRYHFGRLFYYIADMPLSEYIRKRKLTRAAEELVGSNVKVIDMAVKYGYDSADSFTRAFKVQHGVTPSELRKAGYIINKYPKLHFSIDINNDKGEEL